MNTGEHLEYRINGLDQIIFVNEDWDIFAANNDGQNILSSKILHRSIWDFISDHTTRQIYHLLFDSVRKGATYHFQFRCDSFLMRRLMEMDMKHAGNSVILFSSKTLSIEQREPQNLLLSYRRTTEEFLRMCSWCKKIHVNDSWAEVETAIKELGLFEKATLPAITHGICEECYVTMRSLIKK